MALKNWTNVDASHVSEKESFWRRLLDGDDDGFAPDDCESLSRFDGSADDLPPAPARQTTASR